MDKKIFTDIPFDLDFNQLKESLKLRDNKRIIEKATDLIEQAQNVAKPKAIYIETLIEKRDIDYIVIKGVMFKSKELKDHTNHVDVVFPYVMTCGTEIEKISNEIEDVMSKYILDGIKTMILHSTTDYISEHIKANYGFENIKYDIPGSLDEWQMSAQTQLFQIIGEITELIGVRLSDSYIMNPSKSVSGIYYAG